MRITRVRIKLTHPTIANRDKLKAFCTAIIDDEFAVHDIKIIERSNGPFMAMPTRKRLDKCPQCKRNNCLTAKFCNECGERLPFIVLGENESLYAEVAHPLTAEARKVVEGAILDTYWQEKDLVNDEYEYDWQDYDFPVSESLL